MENKTGLQFPTGHEVVKITAKTVPAPPDIPDLKSQALQILEDAKNTKVENLDERIDAESKIIQIKKIIKNFKNLLDPGIVAAKLAYDTLRGKKKEIMDPLTEAEGRVKAPLGAYYQKERAEKARLQKIEDDKIAGLRRKEQEAMKKVVEAEEKGDIKGADRILKEQAAEEIKVLATPPIQWTPEKMKGVSDKMIPKWEVTDASKLPEQYRTITPIRPKITGLIRAHGPEEAMRLCPGIRAWEEPSISVRG